MMAIGLWLLGLLLIFLEFYLPGAILGTAGGILILISFVFFIQEFGPLLSFIYFLLILASIAGVIKYALWKIPRTKKEDSIYSDDAQVGFYASAYDHAAIGKEGMVVSDLKPGGWINVEGKQHPAISESGYLTQGTKVVVLSGEGDSLIVRRK